MGVRFPSVQSNTFVGPLPASNAETVVLVSPPLTLPLDFATVLVLWSAIVNGGTSTTEFDFRLRRGTTTAGASLTIAVWAVTAIVGSVRAMSGWYFDTPGAVAGQQYALTVQQIGATAAGVWGDGAIVAFAL